MLLDKQKDKPKKKDDEDGLQIPQAVPVVDSSAIEKKLKKEEAKRKQEEEEIRERRRCGCW